MKKIKYYIGILLISFLCYSNLYAGKYYKDLYGNKKVLLATSCVSIDDYRTICYIWDAKFTHDSVYFKEKRSLLFPDTALFRQQFKVPFDLRRVVKNKREISAFYKQTKTGKKLSMTEVSFQQAALYVELIGKSYAYNPVNAVNSYSLPTLKDYEIALKKNMLTDGVEYLADGNIVIIDTKNKKLEVVTSTSMPIKFRMVIHKIIRNP